MIQFRRFVSMLLCCDLHFYDWLFFVFMQISGEAQELFSVRHGPVRTARILPAPQCGECSPEEKLSFRSFLFCWSWTKDSKNDNWSLFFSKCPSPSPCLDKLLVLSVEMEIGNLNQFNMAIHFYCGFDLSPPPLISM